MGENARNPTPIYVGWDFWDILQRSFNMCRVYRDVSVWGYIPSRVSPSCLPTCAG